MQYTTAIGMSEKANLFIDLVTFSSKGELHFSSAEASFPPKITTMSVKPRNRAPHIIAIVYDKIIALVFLASKLIVKV